MAIDHLNFKIEKGQVYGFLGPNGAGKSTTMNIMTGYLGATEGEVLIDGHDILKEPNEGKKSTSDICPENTAALCGYAGDGISGICCKN